MKNVWLTFVAVSTLFSGFVLAQRERGSMVLYGKVPGRYLPRLANNKSHKAMVVVKDGVITQVKATNKKSEAKKRAQTEGIPFLDLKSRGGSYDIIYPGLIDLHNHNNQNVIPVWREAHGSYANRFEWRSSANEKFGYKQGVKLNMNPWYGGIHKDRGFKQIGLCATTRWTILQSLVRGNTIQQGSINCVKGFGIPNLSNNDVLLIDDESLKMKSVSQPGDLVKPDDMPVLWQHLRGTKNFPKDFLNKVVKHYCPKAMQGIKKAYYSEESKRSGPMVLEEEVLKLPLFKKSQAGHYIDKNCHEQAELENYRSFRSFLNNGTFATVASKLRELENPKFSSLITHLSEGRRSDPYNKLELKIFNILGFAREFVNIIHAVGVTPSEYKNIMAKNKMGMIWSPSSNYFLYNQTADIVAAFKAYKSTGDKKIRIALGSDWTPTGTASALEELIIARDTVKKRGAHGLINDKELYKMVTENPARMINYLEIDPDDGIHGVGTVKKDATATLIVVKQQKGQKENYINPYTNLVTAKEKHINLVIVQGRPLYGEIDYLKAYDSKTRYEELPGYFSQVNRFVADNGQSKIPLAPKGHDERDEKAFERLFKRIVKSSHFKKLKPKNADNHCGFTKGLVHMSSLEENVPNIKGKSGVKQQPLLKNIVKLKNNHHLNLDRFYHIQALVGTFVTTQSRNVYGTREGKIEDRIKQFPSLFTCNNPTDYADYIANYISPVPGNDTDQVAQNIEHREQFRQMLSDDGAKQTHPHRLAEKYGLPYDPIKGIYQY